VGFISDFGTAVGKSIDVTGLANSLFDKIWPWAQTKIDEETTKLEPWAEAKASETVDKYTPIIIEKLLAMMPTLVAAAAKATVEEAFKGIPNLPNVQLPAVPELTQQVIQSVASDAGHIPGLSDLINIPALFESWMTKGPH
jgi:hypothetical protein